jgi:phage terminase large subunit
LIVKVPYDFTPRPYQQRFMSYLDNGGKRAFSVWHRRAGKDLAGLNQVAKAAMERVGLYWYLLPTYRQAKRVIWQGFRNDGKTFLGSVFPDALVSARNEQDMRLELRNGSVIQLMGSDSYDSLVGANPVGVIFSEFALSKPSAWDYVRPMLTANGGWAAFNTTPRGLNHAWKLWQYAISADGVKDGWFSELCTIWDTGAFPDPQSIMDQERRSGMPDALIRQEYLCDFTAALVGSVWGDLVEALDKEGRTLAFDRAEDDVYTSWDIGIGDSTAIWFWRLRGEGLEFIDYFEAHGKPLSYYADEIEKRKWKVRKHWLPHDARARTLQTGSSVIEQLVMRFGANKVSIGPRLSLLDGVQAARWLLQKDGTRIHPDCGVGLDSLRSYHYEFDEDTKAYSAKPEHDWSSHAADAFRYAAVVARQTGLLAKPRNDGKKKSGPFVPVPLHYGFSLDDLYAMKPKTGRRI